jgi:VTC domain
MSAVAEHLTSTRGERAMTDAVNTLDSVTLEQIQELADLQTRIDRKYVLPVSLVAEMIDAQDSLMVLEIGGQRRFGYESVYFDTPDLVSYRGAAHSRRRRFKVRTRTYTDSGDCVLEVKVKGGRGETIKERLPYNSGSAERLSPQALAFAERVLSPVLAHAQEIVPQLAPTLATTYDRMTFVDPLRGTRLTCDSGLLCTALTDIGHGGSLRRHGRAGARTGLGEQVVLESKSPGTATSVDRWLWARGYRPESLSKYCVGLAALDDGLPSNKWNQSLRRHFA